MMPVTDKISKERVAKFAEVFTPPGTVFFMILQDGIRACVADVDKTIFDPACGHGQFPCSELVWKMFFGLERLDEDFILRALKSLHGVDIQRRNDKKSFDSNRLRRLQIFHGQRIHAHRRGKTNS